MLKYADTKVTFSEVPDEISLCISLSGCPHRCKGCHSSYLQEDIGTELNEEILDSLIQKNNGISCVCFMGGDNDLPELHHLAEYIHREHKLKTAWYTGLEFTPTMDRIIAQPFDYIKTGPYIESVGPLSSPRTNQRFYKRISTTGFKDITSIFYKDVES